MKTYNDGLIEYKFTKNGLKMEIKFEKLKIFFEDVQTDETIFGIKNGQGANFIDSLVKNLISPITYENYQSDKMLDFFEKVLKELISKNQDEDIKKWIKKK